ncbi:TetR/AcrR family transcriptional regulator [Rhodococcus zopfii]|uniref:TetR/AcrR family transcriptional regulator n=1 Tax=Rhodococcus zopfii TaxID=43772 RepID=A0ABU3WPS8_9NOCA|nr:TetR/AcrR family transcriptional regulator [Rhodococcus zopfii]
MYGVTEIKRRQLRWQATRATLMAATVKSLVEHGYAGTTMQRVQAYAGVSRGTLTHHFGSMQDLLVAAIHHVAEEQLEQITTLLKERAPKQGPDELVQILHRFMSGPMFVAGLELWLAARTDDSLRAALAPTEREFGHKMRAVLQQSGIGGDGTPITRDDLESLFVLFRGLAVTHILREDDGFELRLLHLWADQARGRSDNTAEKVSEPSVKG